MHMQLTLYFFRQFLPSFFFGTALFLFVLILERLFDLIDLIFNKGVGILTVLKLLSLFVPTVLPLTFPMAIILASVVTFGRISEENELTAVQAAGISPLRVLWLTPIFALLLSLFMLPFNTRIAPWANRMFRVAFEELVQSEPLINITAKKFFAVRNLRIYAQAVDNKTKRLRDVFVYQSHGEERPPDRIYGKTGFVDSDQVGLRLVLQNGQMQRYDALDPRNIIHTTFQTYEVNIPLNMAGPAKATRYRNIPSSELRALISELKRKGFKTHPLQAEYSLRYAVAFAPFCLGIMALPLATQLKRGGRSFGFGVTIIMIFVYYLVLIFGLTMAEKGIIPSHPALWIANIICVILGSLMFLKLHRQ